MRTPRTAAGRVTCICGASVLVDDAANHLLRSDHRPHRIISWPLPATVAGRDLLKSTAVFGSAEEIAALQSVVLPAILAIEDEMYDLASNEGYHLGIADCKEHDPAHRAEPRGIDVERLARAWKVAVGGYDDKAIRSAAVALAKVYEAANPPAVEDEG